jgi:hypothetical protein
MIFSSTTIYTILYKTQKIVLETLLVVLVGGDCGGHSWTVGDGDGVG